MSEKYITKDTKDAAIAKHFVMNLNSLIQPMGLDAKWRKARSAAVHEETETSVGNCQVVIPVGKTDLVVNMTIYRRGFVWLNIYVHEGGEHEAVIIARDILDQSGFIAKYSEARRAIALSEVTPLKAAAVLEALYLFLPERIS